jgi:transposase
MRGLDSNQQHFFSYVSPDSRVPKDHPLRPIRRMVDKALEDLWRLFSDIYSHTGRPSIAPEQLFRALLLQVLYSIRSERLLMEQLDYNLLFRWFVGLSMDDPVWDHSSFSKNRERLLNTETARMFFQSIRSQAQAAELLSDEHFSVDGTLLEAWASMKSFKPKDGAGPSDAGSAKNPEVDFRGDSRKNSTHASVTDPDVRLYKKAKGAEAKLAYMGHVLMENRNGLVVDTELTVASGTAERESAEEMIARIPGNDRITLGADKAYDTQEFVETLRQFNITPHVAQKSRGSAIDRRTTRHVGYGISQRVRKRIEEVFGWLKTIGTLQKLRHRGKERVDWIFTFATAAYNMVRMRNIELQETG